MAVPSKETPPIVLAFAKAVAVAALPEVSWLPAWFTPGRLILAVPSKETPPIVLAVCNCTALVAVVAVPVTSPVTLPVRLPVTLPVTSPVTSPITSPVRSPVIAPEALIVVNAPVDGVAPPIAVPSIAPPLISTVVKVLVPEKVALPPKTSCPKVIPAFAELSLIVLASSAPAAVTTPVTLAPPDRTMLLREMLSSRLTVTPLLAAAEVRLVPPEIVKDSVRRLISSDPLSPATVNPLPTAVVVADVIRPLESTVIMGTSAAPR